MKKKEFAIILISRDEETKAIFRKVIQHFNNTQLIILRHIKDIYKNVNPSVIFLDKTQIDSELSDISSRKVLILNSNYSNDIKEYYKSGIDNILLKPINSILLYGIIYKSQNTLREEIFQFNNIELNQNAQFVKYKNCKILLSETETSIMKILITNKKFISIAGIKSLMGRNISKDSIRASIHRIRIKFINATGQSVIKNKYGVGYYIS